MSLEEQILRRAEAPEDYFGEVTFAFREGRLVLIRKSQTLLPNARDNRRGTKDDYLNADQRNFS